MSNGRNWTALCAAVVLMGFVVSIPLCAADAGVKSKGAARFLKNAQQGDLKLKSAGHLSFGPDGLLLATYRKLHLFDIDLPDQVSFQESSFVAPGDEIVVTDTPAGRIGQATCYDLRFPELFRALVDRDATLIVIPSAFTQATGRDHWQVLLRARAIENQAFVIAPNQYGRHAPGIQF